MVSAERPAGTTADRVLGTSGFPVGWATSTEAPSADGARGNAPCEARGCSATQGGHRGTPPSHTAHPKQAADPPPASTALFSDPAADFPRFFPESQLLQVAHKLLTL